MLVLSTEAVVGGTVGYGEKDDEEESLCWLKNKISVYVFNVSLDYRRPSDKYDTNEREHLATCTY